MAMGWTKKRKEKVIWWGEGNEHTKGTVQKKKEIIRSFGESCVVYDNVRQENDMHSVVRWL
jgi:hypothetical protein